MIKYIKKLFAKPTANEQVSIDIESSKLKLMEHEELASYHAQMVIFYKKALLRLNDYQDNGIR